MTRNKKIHTTTRAIVDAASRLIQKQVIHWTPTNNGIPGNEKADNAEKTI